MIDKIIAAWAEMIREGGPEQIAEMFLGLIVLVSINTMTTFFLALGKKNRGEE